MSTSTIEYMGSLRVESIHSKSGVKIFSDAPPDNKGKGEGFSPTDYCATSLAMCMLTIAGIYAQENDIDIIGSQAEVTKHMASGPRRISKIEVSIQFKTESTLSEKSKLGLKRSAKECPVAKSLHPEIEQDLTFSFQ